MPYTSKVSNAGVSVDTNNDGIPDGRAITLKNAGNFSTFSLTNGVLSMAPTAAGATVGGADTQVQFNDGGSFGGESTFVYNKTSNTLTIANVVISGDLTVSGTTTTVNTATLDIADNIITLNSDYSGSSPSENAGIKVNRGGGSAPDAEFLWDETNDQWDFDTYALGSVGKVYAAGSNAVYTFTSDTDTGIEHTGLDQLGLLVGNTRVLMVNANGVHIDSTGATGAGSNQALLVDNISIDTNTIASTNTNGNIVIAPNGTGDVQLDADTIRVGDSGATATITTNGAGDLALDTNGGSDSGSIVIQNGASGDILINPVTSRYVGINQVTPTATLHVDGDAIITGDLTIQGATTQVDSTDTFIKDRLITLNDGESGTGVSGNIAGIEIDRGASGEIARFVWDDNDDFFKVQIEATAGSGSFTDANLKTNQIDAMGNVTIAGNLDVDTNVLSVDAVNNRVGINTSPTVALDVSGSAKISSDITVTGDAEFQGKTVANLVQHVTNGNGVSEGALQKGEPVYISGTTAGGQAIVKEADANGSGTYPAIGLVWSDIAFGGTGYIITFGIVEDVPAGVFTGSDPSAGDTVYLAELSAHITVDRPTASGSKVQNIGRITKSNVSVSGGTGTAHILVQGPGRINDIPNDVGDEDIVAAASATNYTPTGSTVEGHLAGIDTALGGIGYSDVEAVLAVENEPTLDLIGSVTVAGTLTVDTNVLHVDVTNDRVGIGTTSPEADLNVVSASAGDIFVLECTDAGAISGPDITLIRDSSSPADDDFLGRIVFKGRDDGGNLLEYGNIKAQLGDATNGSEGFNMFIQGVIAGTNRPFLGLRGNDGLAGASQAEVCVNDQGIDMDFRVETDNDTAALFVQGSSDKVGISTTSPVATLDVQSGKTFRATRLLTVSLSSTTTLNEASHGGRYVFVTGASTTINLPGTHAAGLHFTLLSNDANGFTLASSDNMNGSASNITVSARNGVTCISDGTDWVVLGA